MDAIQEMLKLDFVQLGCGLLALMIGVTSIVTVVEKFSIVIGKPVKWVKKKNEDHELLIALNKDYHLLKENYEKDRKEINEFTVEMRNVISEIKTQVELYPIWHSQSIQIRNELNESIQSLSKSQGAVIDKLNKMEDDNKKRERNKLRDRLYQSFRYYTSKDKNPMQAWSKAEKDTFDKLYDDYIDQGGNGNVRDEVKPAMDMLDVIDNINNPEKIVELYNSRK